ncbi:disease resistance-like protein DSC1 [Abrus precatorius]|uniref:Disease resistance-like protein DSC1 n=1 Tax=Abrus precatorius TaxID=3816 RepID=A0A8B8K0Y0_ABRPR|nr:disease resistance-like protein DSC1 [Abrus precatorius]
MSSSTKSYDVFISFRGEDTRANFTSNLHSALQIKSIRTYIDYELNRGDDVEEALPQAIQNSEISIVVFSENYASSKWCLKELVQIMNCRNCEGQVVIPVFYNIDPSHVRNQTGSFEKAFATHVQDLTSNEPSQIEDEVSKWKDALRKAANLSGWDSRTFMNDSQVIQNIVNDVLQKLYLKYPNELQGVIGIENYYDEIEPLLENFRRIGIWGMGGIGKTTTAKTIFSKHFPKYDSVCFLSNVREESQRLGLTYTRDKLLSELLKEPITTSNFSGSAFMRRRLSSKKVFIVLDDMASFRDLDYLYGELGDLGNGSTLIVTTRDKHLLKGRVDKICEVKKRNFEESLELFCLEAFKQSNPKKGYEHLSERAVKYAGGNPLALKVLGSHFHSRKIEFWECELSNFEKKKESCDEILEVLQVSYNALRNGEKEIFLDIAFFFKDEDADFVIKILNACGFNATSGIEILQDKALVTISTSNKVQMHDLLQELGLDIVRKEFSKDPGRRSRLRNIEEVRDVLKNNKGTDAVEGITLDLSANVDLQFTADTFNMMSKLRLLRLYVPLGKTRLANVEHPEVFDRCSDELRYLEWNGYPLKSLPQNFCAIFLVEIRMPHSNVEELWQGMQDLMNLEQIDLSECKKLVMLPDLSRASKLKTVVLSGCERLCVVHPSLLSVDTLKTLILDRCKKLKSLKSKNHFRFLEDLSVNYCSSLEEFSISSELIKQLDLSTTSVKILDSTIGRLSKLEKLNLEGLQLKNLPNELCCLISLHELRISKCGSVINKEMLHDLCDRLRLLNVLHLKECDKLFELPDNISELTFLHKVSLDGSSIERLPESIKHLPRLEILSLQNCRKLQFLPELPPLIKTLNVGNCKSLVTVSPTKHFSVHLIEKKCVSFENGMKLSEFSLCSIMEDALFVMKSVAFHDLLKRYNGFKANSKVEVCLPGNSVPRTFTYRTTESSITIGLANPDQFSHLVGLMYSIVLSPSPWMKHQVTFIRCQCYRADGTKVGNATTWQHKPIRKLNSDHVFLWYDCFHWYNIFQGHAKFLVSKTHVENLRFQFSVIPYRRASNDQISIKECGIHLIGSSRSEFYNCLYESDMTLESKIMCGLEFDIAHRFREVDWRLYCALRYNDFATDAEVKKEQESRRRAMLWATKKLNEKKAWYKDSH